MREEISKLKSTQINSPLDGKKEIKTDRPKTNIDFEAKTETISHIYQTSPGKVATEQSKYSNLKSTLTPNLKSDIEKFIGENLINKIGSLPIELVELVKQNIAIVLDL